MLSVTPPSKQPWGFIKDPLYGYVHVSESERRVIDTRAIQRLRRIKQLAGVEYVYPAANHTRFEHVLGTMHLAGFLARSLPVGLGDEDVHKLRLAALLHDVGHGPFSHLFEPLLIKCLNRTHEDMASWIISNSGLTKTLRDEGFNPDELSRLAVGNLHDSQRPFLDQVVRSSVDVDKMDFIIRDSYHTGAGYGSVDVFRLIYTMDVLDGNLAVNLSALPTLEAFLLARLESFRAIYFHRASRAVEIMLLKALERAEEEQGFLHFGSAEDYLALDDYTVWSILYRCTEARQVVKDIEERKLLKCAYERTFFVEDRLVTSILTNEAVREQIVGEISARAGVAPEDIVIDTPSLPSVPYRHAIEVQPMDIPVFIKTKTGEKVPQRLTEISRIVDVLRTYLNIVRVYTKEVYREKVGKVCEEVLGKPALSEIVSY